MPFYQRKGQLPHKRHTQFTKPDGTLHHEQLFGTIGFVGMSSLLYHLYPPTMVAAVADPRDARPVEGVREHITSRRIPGFAATSSGHALDARIPMMFNADCTISVARPDAEDEADRFYKNADSDEVVFIHDGEGTLETMFGHLAYKPGDYLVIPRGVIHRWAPVSGSEQRWLVVESAHPIVTPKRYRNHFGQLLEHSPYCERDFRTPELQAPVDREGAFPIDIRKEGMIHTVTYGRHPFDVVGWDGYHFPYAFSIHDFEPITGRVHQPPPVHQTFETDAFVICSFCPRLYDYHPKAIPAPYNHSNIDSDEVLYYVEGNFMSRKGISRGDLTLHPGGIPHGPHPGTYEGSIGKTGTAELAVMVDTFRPLRLTQQALDIEDSGYHTSWLSYAPKKID
jgi:homogentisate 1,2-dioxygenase